MNYQQVYNSLYSGIIYKSIEYLRGYLKPGQKVLDVGAGTGWFAEGLVRRFKVNVECIDVTDRDKDTNLKFQVYDGKHFPYQNKSMDIVLLLSVLHHCIDPEGILREAIRVTKPQGKIVIHEDIPSGVVNYILVKLHIFHYNILNKSRSKGHFLNEEEWRNLFKEYNLKVISNRTLPKLLSYPVLNVQYILEVPKTNLK